MYKVLKEICDDKERVKEHEMEAGRVVQARTPEFLNFCICSVQVRGSARVRGKAAADALQENLKNFSDELQTNAACIGVDGKIKLPKKRKFLPLTKNAISWWWRNSRSPNLKIFPRVMPRVLCSVLHVHTPCVQRVCT